MNKTKTFATIFVIAFFICLISPIILMPFMQSGINENRKISELPYFKTESGKLNQNYFNELTTYVAEHFAGRTKLISLNNEIKYSLLKTSGDDQVIIGKDGWLFFDETINDYVGVTLSKEEINNIAINMKKVQDYLSSKGKKSIVMIVPNKNSVYSEFMPDIYGKKSAFNNLDLLQEAFESNEVNYLDVKKILIEGKSTDELYLKRDTHWNNTGARLVLNNLYEKIGVDFSHELNNYKIEKSHSSDLSAILFPEASNTENQRIYEAKNEFEYTCRLRSMDDFNITTANSTGIGKNILLYRDSFGRAIIPYMAECFDMCAFNRSTPYDLSVIDSADYDYIVFEIVERNLKDLGDIIIP